MDDTTCINLSIKTWETSVRASPLAGKNQRSSLTPFVMLVFCNVHDGKDGSEDGCLFLLGRALELWVHAAEMVVDVVLLGLRWPLRDIQGQSRIAFEISERRQRRGEG